MIINRDKIYICKRLDIHWKPRGVKVNKVMYTSIRMFRYRSETKESQRMCSEEKRELCTEGVNYWLRF